jgi:RimJ/RimL family protein N-acetyltransferase
MQEALRDQTLAIVQRLKEEPAGCAGDLPVFQYGRQLARLEPVTREDLNKKEAIALLSQWRPGDGGVEGTRRWLAREFLDVADRLLFWVKGLDGTPVGYAGLAHFDFAEGRVEVWPLRRGVPGLLPGAMYAAVQALLAWAFQTAGVRTVRLEVPSDNLRALRLGERSGFRPPMPNPGGAGGEPFAVMMSLSRADWMAGHRLEKAAQQAHSDAPGVSSTARQNAAA